MLANEKNLLQHYFERRKNYFAHNFFLKLKVKYSWILVGSQSCLQWFFYEFRSADTVKKIKTTWKQFPNINLFSPLFSYSQTVWKWAWNDFHSAIVFTAKKVEAHFSYERGGVQTFILLFHWNSKSQITSYETNFRYSCFKCAHKHHNCFKG